jgi:hypothetical protein
MRYHLLFRHASNWLLSAAPRAPFVFHQFLVPDLLAPSFGAARLCSLGGVN